MRFDKMTLKAQEAIQEAQNIASKLNHQEITAEHLLLALLNQNDGTAPAILAKIGANKASIIQELDEALNALPQVTGASLGQAYISQELKQIFDLAYKEASLLKDEFISTEHFLI
ncbi:MAG: type VI secretion system ATPase TssH, partial [Deltaproteobacteria bacterium CG07_land_8_20_14_0_80_38_7]